MSSLNFQPIAAAASINDADAKNYHLNWLVVDGKDNWLNQEPKLQQLELSLRFGYLVVKAAGMLRLDIPLDVIEDDTSVERTATVAGQQVRVVDEGEMAGAWFTQWLGKPCRLVKVHPQAESFNWPV